MIRTAFAIAAMTVVFCGVTAGADDADPIKTRLDAAKTAPVADLQAARDSFVAEIQKRQDTAQKAGDFDRFEKLRADLEGLRDRGELPKSVNAGDYQAAVATIQARLEAGFAQARKEYTQAGKITEAEAVDEELKQFRKNNQTNTGSTTQVAIPPAKPDRFRVGAVWIGQVRWKSHPQDVLNYMLVITDRAGDRFKAIYRIDHGTPNSPKNVEMVDVEGAVKETGLVYQQYQEQMVATLDGEVLRVVATGRNGDVQTGDLRLKSR